jgi:integrase
MKGFLRERSKGSWELTVELDKDPVTGRRHRHFETVRARNKGIARERLNELMVEIQSGGFIEASKDLTLSDYLRGWLKHYVELNCSPKTIESYRMLVEKHILPSLGSIRLAALDAPRIQAFYGKKKESGLSNRTVRYMYSLLAESLSQAVKMGLVTRNAAQATEPPRIDHKTISTLASEDIDRFLKSAAETSYYVLFYLLLHTGCRRGEALALKWRNIDLGIASLGVTAYISITSSVNKVNGQMITKEPKTVAGKRRIAMSPSLALVLRQHRVVQEAFKRSLGTVLSDEDYVFSHPDGLPYDPSTVSHAFNAVIRKAGLPPMPLHGLRHSHFTYLLQAGIHPKIVQERAGHSSIRVTLDTYGHVVGGLQEAAAQKFDEFISAKGHSVENVGKMSAKVDITVSKS